MSIRTETQALLAGLWKKNEPLMRERLVTLQQAAEAAESGHLTPELREQAISTSHKLAGSLGMFGFPRGTDIARELEQDFAAPSAAGLTPKVAALGRIMFP